MTFGHTGPVFFLFISVKNFGKKDLANKVERVITFMMLCCLLWSVWKILDEVDPFPLTIYLAPFTELWYFLINGQDIRIYNDAIRLVKGGL